MAEKEQPADSPAARQVVPRLIEQEMKQSYLNYSMSVIVGRALPDVRDGLKPVHRRVLYTMFESGLLHNKPFRKSANVVGTCMARYHPHGDSAIYDTLVRLAQDFSLRYPLVNGQGNFGSVDGDSAAAMRYTEARMTKLSEELLQDIDKETVEFAPNFDGSIKEPAVLPSKFPNLLINGSAGIAVGMATNIPPHNIKEICGAVIAKIDEPGLDADGLMRYVSGPDFPTGGIIMDDGGIAQAYRTGRGKVVVRAKIDVEERKAERMNLIVTEIPFQVNKSILIEDIAKQVRDKVIQGIMDIRDESDRDGMRIVFELKAGANPDIVQNQFFKHSRLQTTFGIINLALVNNQPRTLPLPDMIQHFIDHRFEMVTKRSQFDLTKARERSHILEGLIVALNNIDKVVAVIKGSKSADVARMGLQASFSFTDAQSQAILEMRLQRLTALEQDKIHDEQSDLVKRIAFLIDLLSSRPKLLNVIKEEMSSLIKAFGDDRRTRIERGGGELEVEELIKPEDVVVTISHAGYVKRLPVDTYRQQKRGGRGVTGASTREEDFIEKVFIANTHDTLLVFTDKGKVHWLRVFDVPQAGRTAMGTALINILALDQNEKTTACIPVNSYDPNHFILMATSKGAVKKVALDAFSNQRRGGIVAVSLQPDDRLVGVELTDGKKQILMATDQGMAVKFEESDVRDMGRTAMGVRGVKLKGDDKVVGILIADPGASVLTVTQNGFGKRTYVSEYRLTTRGGVGVINLKITDKNGKVVSVQSVSDSDEVMLISRNGIIIRTPVKGISVIGRATQGVRVMRLEEDDSLVSATIVEPDEQSRDASSAQPSQGPDKDESPPGDMVDDEEDDPVPKEDGAEEEPESGDGPQQEGDGEGHFLEDKGVTGSDGLQDAPGLSPESPDPYSPLPDPESGIPPILPQDPDPFSPDGNPRFP